MKKMILVLGLTMMGSNAFAEIVCSTWQLVGPGGTQYCAHCSSSSNPTGATYCTGAQKGSQATLEAAAKAGATAMLNNGTK